MSDERFEQLLGRALVDELDLDGWDELSRLMEEDPRRRDRFHALDAVAGLLAAAPPPARRGAAPWRAPLLLAATALIAVGAWILSPRGDVPRGAAAGPGVAVFARVDGVRVLPGDIVAPGAAVDLTARCTGPCRVTWLVRGPGDAVSVLGTGKPQAPQVDTPGPAWSPTTPGRYRVEAHATAPDAPPATADVGPPPDPAASLDMEVRP